MLRSKRGWWLAGVALGPLWVGAAEPTKAPLTPTTMPVRHAIASPALAKSDQEAIPGVAVGYHRLQFDDNSREESFTVAGRQLTLIWNGDSRFSLKDGAGTAELSSTAGQGSSKSLDLGNGRSYVLALPALYGQSKSEDSPGMGLAIYASGSLQQGRIGDQIIAFYDFDTDGRYTIEKDVYRLGGHNAGLEFSFFLPISKYVSTPGGIYELHSLAEDGSQFSYAPYTGERAELKVNFAAPSLRADLVCGSKSAGLFVNPPSDAAQATVVPGEYNVLLGTVFTTTPSREELGKHPIAFVLPGKQSPVRVATREAGRMELGAPFRFEFAVTMDEGKITIKPDSIHLYGKAGEEYTQLRYKADAQVFLVSGEKKIELGKMAYG